MSNKVIVVRIQEARERERCLMNFELMKIERIDRTRGNVTRDCGWENNGTILQNERLIRSSLVFFIFQRGR